MNCDAVINIQGDEPLIDPEIINIVSRGLKDNIWAHVSTAAVEIQKKEEIDDPNIVKLVFSIDGKALYFSRSKIPYNIKSKPRYFKHIGIYGYKKDFLKKFIALKPSYLELTESLEQLRVLENGYNIHVSIVKYNSLGVSTPKLLYFTIETCIL